MQLDSFTILVAGCSMLVLLGAIFLFLWARDRSSSELLWWGLPFVFGGAALVVYMRPDWSDDLLPLAIGNGVRVMALGCLWQGARVFQHRPPALLPMLGGSLLCGVLCLIPPIVDHLAMRIAVVSVLNGVFCALVAYEFWRGRDEMLASRWPAMAVFVSFSAMMFGRAALAGVAPFPVGILPLDSIWYGALVGLVFAHSAFGAVLFLAMIMERRVAEQRSFAMSDQLTGLMNRRAFADFAARMSRRRAGIRSAMAILVLDLDHFKQVNDRFGHEIGDRMLRAFADVAETNVRPSDQLFRMGGEEFCFAMPETSLTEAIAVAERIRKAFEACTLETAIGPADATVSIGIAATQYAVEVEVLLAAADAAVYEAKARGRNRVVVAEPATLGHRFRTEPPSTIRRSA